MKRTFLLAFLVPWPLNASPVVPASKAISIQQNYNQTITLPGLQRLAVGNSKIARVRAVPGRGFLITGIRPGRTLVRAWAQKGEEHVYEITVTVPEAGGTFSVDIENVVKVSLELLELDSQFGQTVGVRWPDVLQWSGGGSVQGDFANVGLNYVFSFSSAKGFLEHLQQEGWARVVARPEVSVRLGEEAAFHSGGEIPVATSSESYGRSHRHVEWKGYGLTVRVRPQSADHLQINSNIRMEISELDRSTGGDGIPGFTKRSLDTKMSSQDGEMVLLSGLAREIRAAKEQSIPILGSLPVVGPLLFKRTEQHKEGHDLLIAVTFAFRNQARDQAERTQLIERMETGAP